MDERAVANVRAMAFFCEDIRFEAGQKPSLMGCHLGQLVLPVPPARLKSLFIFLRIIVRAGAFNEDLLTHVLLNGQRLREDRIPKDQILVSGGPPVAQFPNLGMERSAFLHQWIELKEELSRLEPGALLSVVVAGISAGTIQCVLEQPRVTEDGRNLSETVDVKFNGELPPIIYPRQIVVASTTKRGDFDPLKFNATTMLFRMASGSFQFEGHVVSVNAPNDAKYSIDFFAVTAFGADYHRDEDIAKISESLGREFLNSIFRQIALEAAAGPYGPIESKYVFQASTPETGRSEQHALEFWKTIWEVK